MEQFIPSIVFLAVLITLFIFAANKYNKSQQRITQHIKDGNIIPAHMETVQEVGDSLLEIVLYPRHFTGNYWVDECAIAKALKELFPLYAWGVGIDKVFMQDKRSNDITKYMINSRDSKDVYLPEYTATQFSNDKRFVENSININNQSPIRWIRLIKVNL